jgi:subtilisin family serine protease
MRSLAAAAVVLSLGSSLPVTATGVLPHGAPLVDVTYSSNRALARATAGRATVLRTIPALHIAEVQPKARGFLSVLRRTAGIMAARRVLRRAPAAEPALFELSAPGVPFEWQYGATHTDAVPSAVLRAAASVTIAVIDTGADLAAPDLEAKSPRTFNVRLRSADVRDVNGHGTFVASLAAGSVTNGIGIAGFGGDARLLVIKAGRDDGTLSDFDEANAIVYAVEHGARVINLSVGGTTTSSVERRGIDYAARHGVLVVAAVGNEYGAGNPVEYPAALLQPVGSDGRGGSGLAVGASSSVGARAFFSNTGSQLSLLAPGDNVFGAVSSLSPPDDYPRSDLPGSGGGLYGYGSGTSFAAPEVAGAAALVMAANPLLRATDVARILKQTATNHGSWNRDSGYGVLDVGAAVAAAESQTRILVGGVRLGRSVRVRWNDVGASHYRVTVRVDGRPERVLFADTTKTSTVVAVRRNHRYVFTVTALDGDATSGSYTVRA